MDPNEVDEYCPEVRVADSRESREVKEKQEEARHKSRRGGPGDDLFRDQMGGERRMFKEDGTPVQMNTAKWPFEMEDDGTNITVDVALPKFLDSAQVWPPPDIRGRRDARRHSRLHARAGRCLAQRACGAWRG